MQVDAKYYRNDTVHRTLLQNAEDPTNNLVSCGFLHRQGNTCDQRDVYFQHYGGLYVISGTGIYVDAVTGKEYPVTPGCVLQRMPGKLHHTFIDRDSNWLEFYFCAGAKVFEMLVSLKLVTDEPVFYAGESMEIFERILAYQQRFTLTDDYHAGELVLEFQKLLCYLNNCRVTPEKNDWIQTVCEKLRQNCQVGASLETIAAECGMGYENLRKQFRQTFGCSLSQYRIQLRINVSKTMLLDQEMSIKEVAAKLGYCDTYAFCNQFKQQVGVSPGKFVSDWGKQLP